MSSDIQVAVIGGGIVGCSVLYHLARLGWTDTTLIEKRILTSGSTWHAAGNVTYFGHYPSITRLYVDSVTTYLEAEKEANHSVVFINPEVCGWQRSKRNSTLSAHLDRYSRR